MTTRTPSIKKSHIADGKIQFSVGDKFKDKETGQLCTIINIGENIADFTVGDRGYGFVTIYWFLLNRTSLDFSSRITEG